MQADSFLGSESLLIYLWNIDQLLAFLLTEQTGHNGLVVCTFMI